MSVKPKPWLKAGYVAPVRRIATPIGSAGKQGLIGQVGAYHPDPNNDPVGLPQAVQASLDAANAIVIQLRNKDVSSNVAPSTVC